MTDDVSYFGAIGYHAQQAAEKFMKAFLVSRQIEFPKTHDLLQLIEIIRPADDKLADALKTSAILSDYGVETRYPGDLPELSRHDATNAAALAAGVRILVERALLDPTEI